MNAARHKYGRTPLSEYTLEELANEVVGRWLAGKIPKSQVNHFLSIKNNGVLPKKVLEAAAAVQLFDELKRRGYVLPDNLVQAAVVRPKRVIRR